VFGAGELETLAVELQSAPWRVTKAGPSLVGGALPSDCLTLTALSPRIPGLLPSKVRLDQTPGQLRQLSFGSPIYLGGRSRFSGRANVEAERGGNLVCPASAPIVWRGTRVRRINRVRPCVDGLAIVEGTHVHPRRPTAADDHVVQIDAVPPRRRSAGQCASAGPCECLLREHGFPVLLAS